MAKTRTFGGVTADVWECVKQTSEKENGTVYNPPDADSGIASTKTQVGEVVLEFNFDESRDSVTYTINKKPLLAPESAIWNGIQETIDHCQYS